MMALVQSEPDTAILLQQTQSSAAQGAQIEEGSAPAAHDTAQHAELTTYRPAWTLRFCFLSLEVLGGNGGVAAVHPELDAAVLLKRPRRDHGAPRVAGDGQHSVAVPLALRLPALLARYPLDHLQDVSANLAAAQESWRFSHSRSIGLQSLCSTPLAYWVP